ncbi:hypothetical protein BC835DRAFT_483197 [Cytidiella melzeri]|nr:hypothetical protein BC835DRAFT_483197 [Cytidiella melzeri]
MASIAQHSAEPSDYGRQHRQGSLIRRSWHAMSDVLSPFSPSALSQLPKKTFKSRPRYTRTDNVPDAEQDEEGHMPTVRDYHAINSLPPQVRVPKKIATPVKVEGKVWFANERTWVSYLNVSILIGALSLALFNASKDQVAKNMAYTYAAISVGTLIYGYAVYQRRITMIRKRDPGHFDQILGPLVISALLFFAVLTNFIIRVKELRRKEVPIPGLSYCL